MSPAAQLAALAWRLQRRIESMPEHVDASWQPRVALPSALAGVRGEDRRRLTADLFRRFCGPLPPLRALEHPAGALARLERPALLSHLAALALLGRPGVLRCCVERQAREALREGLGPAFPMLMARAAGSPAVRGDVAAWTPLGWAWVGYRELAHARAWPHLSLHRLVRLSLPASRDAMPPPSRVPAPLRPLPARLLELPRLFGAEAAC